MIAVSRPNAPAPTSRSWSRAGLVLAQPSGRQQRWITTREASRIVTVSEAGQGRLREWLGIDLPKLRVAA
jgi:hypothetical protein